MTDFEIITNVLKNNEEFENNIEIDTSDKEQDCIYFYANGDIGTGFYAFSLDFDKNGTLIDFTLGN